MYTCTSLCRWTQNKRNYCPYRGVPLYATYTVPTNPQKQKVGQIKMSFRSRSIDILENLDDNSKIIDLTIPLKSETVGDFELLYHDTY